MTGRSPVPAPTARAGRRVRGRTSRRDRSGGGRRRTSDQPRNDLPADAPAPRRRRRARAALARRPRDRARLRLGRRPPLSPYRRGRRRCRAIAHSWKRTLVGVMRSTSSMSSSNASPPPRSSSRSERLLGTDGDPVGTGSVVDIGQVEAEAVGAGPRHGRADGVEEPSSAGRSFLGWLDVRSRPPPLRSRRLVRPRTRRPARAVGAGTGDRPRH